MVFELLEPPEVGTSPLTLLRGVGVTTLGVETVGFSFGVTVGVGLGVITGVGVWVGVELGVITGGEDCFAGGGEVTIATCVDTGYLFTDTRCALIDTPTRPIETNKSAPRYTAGVA